MPLTELSKAGIFWRYINRFRGNFLSPHFGGGYSFCCVLRGGFMFVFFVTLNNDDIHKSQELN